MIDGFSEPAEASELVLGHGSAVVEGRALPEVAEYDWRQNQDTVPAPQVSPLNTIIARLEAAAEQLSHANERLAGASGRLGTPNPGRDPRGAGEAPTNGAGFIGTANDRIDDIFSVIEATGALASAFCEAV